MCPVPLIMIAVFAKSICLYHYRMIDVFNGFLTNTNGGNELQDLDLFGLLATSFLNQIYIIILINNS